jgi:hypothetical protein
MLKLIYRAMLFVIGFALIIFVGQIMASSGVRHPERPVMVMLAAWLVFSIGWALTRLHRRIYG